MRFSLIIPAKNTEIFLPICIASVFRSAKRAESGLGATVQLIIVDDGSTDHTWATISGIKKYLTCDFFDLILVKNPGVGKVAALNTGWSYADGDVVGFIDSDDIVHRSFISMALSRLSGLQFAAHAHAAHIFLDEHGHGSPLCKFPVNPTYWRGDSVEVVRKFISLPRWTWTISRAVGDLIFPMPKDLPYEDTWFSFVIRCSGCRIIKGDESLYLYRQHRGQTFGGIFNYSQAAVDFRMGRLKVLLNVILANFHRISVNLPQRSRVDIESSLRQHRDSGDFGMGKRWRRLALLSRVSFFIPYFIQRIKWAFVR